MKTIRLTRGKVALVDDADYEWLSQWKWHAQRNRFLTLPDRWVAVRFTAGRKNPHPLYMHRELARRWGWPDSPQFDHKDRDALNNRQENLRPASASQNGMNRAKLPGHTSRFKGVSWHKAIERWRAYIQVARRHVSLGYFDCDQDAALAYDAAARQHFGEFARTNFP